MSVSSNTASGENSGWTAPLRKYETEGRKEGREREKEITNRTARKGHYCRKAADILTFRHRASCILGQAFHYSPENAFYTFNQQIYFII